MKHKVYVTRDASITYVAEVDLPLDQIEDRCSKYGFKEDNLGEIEWEVHKVSTLDNVEAYEITHDEEKVIDGQTVKDEVTDKDWSLS